MKKVLLTAAIALLSAPAMADVSQGTPTFNWTQPTQWSDGTALTVSQITGYQLVCTGTATVSRRIATAAGVPPAATAAANRMGPGPYSCTLAVYARVTPTSPEQISVPSNAVSFTVPQPTPGAPTGFSVE